MSSHTSEEEAAAEQLSVHENDVADEIEPPASAQTSPAPTNKTSKANKDRKSAEPVTPKVTPVKKAAKTPAKRKAAGIEDVVKQEGGSEDAEDEAPPSAGKEGAKKRKSTGAVGAVVPIPTSYETASEADKELIRMKESNATWAAIKSRWEELTGVAVAASTLPNRYIRLKANMTQYTDDDDIELKVTLKEIEETFAKEKWSMVSDAMAKKGRLGFSAGSLAKRFKSLQEAQ